jgi:hypothetical protein
MKNSSIKMSFKEIFLEKYPNQKKISLSPEFFELLEEWLIDPPDDQILDELELIINQKRGIMRDFVFDTILGGHDLVREGRQIEILLDYGLDPSFLDRLKIKKFNYEYPSSCFDPSSLEKGEHPTCQVFVDYVEEFQKLFSIDNPVNYRKYEDFLRKKDIYNYLNIFIYYFKIWKRYPPLLSTYQCFREYFECIDVLSIIYLGAERNNLLPLLEEFLGGAEYFYHGLFRSHFVFIKDKLRQLKETGLKKIHAETNLADELEATYNISINVRRISYNQLELNKFPRDIETFNRNGRWKIILKKEEEKFSLKVRRLITLVQIIESLSQIDEMEYDLFKTEKDKFMCLIRFPKIFIRLLEFNSNQEILKQIKVEIEKRKFIDLLLKKIYLGYMEEDSLELFIKLKKANLIKPGYKFEPYCEKCTSLGERWFDEGNQKIIRKLKDVLKN